MLEADASPGEEAMRRGEEVGSEEWPVTMICVDLTRDGGRWDRSEDVPATKLEAFTAGIEHQQPCLVKVSQSEDTCTCFGPVAKLHCCTKSSNRPAGPSDKTAKLICKTERFLIHRDTFEYPVASACHLRPTINNFNMTPPSTLSAGGPAPGEGFPKQETSPTHAILEKR